MVFWFLVRSVSRKGSLLSISFSTVNFMLGCLLFRYVRNLGMWAGFLNNTKQSSTYRRKKRGLKPMGQSSNHLVS